MKKTTIKSFARTGKLANRIFAATLGLIVFASAFTFQSCKDDDDDPEGPKITSISPAPALPGAQITITGQHFSKEAKNNTVNIGGEGATVNSSTETSIITTVPATVTKVGPVDVYVTVEGRKSNVYNTFEIAEPEPDKPVLKTVDPTEAMPGDTIALTGEYLGAQDGATLTIGGETATIIEYSETAIKAQVPELKPGEAEIVLSLKGFGPVKLPVKFMVKAKPISVEGFMPDSAGYGDVVTISGKNFGTEKGDITVMVNGKEQEVTEVTDGQVKIKLEAKTWSGDVVVIKGEQRDTADKKLAYKETYGKVEEVLTGSFRSIEVDKKGNYYVSSDIGYGLFKFSPEFVIQDTIFENTSPTDVIIRKNGEIWISDNTSDDVMRSKDGVTHDTIIKTTASGLFFAENSNNEMYMSSYGDNKVYKVNPDFSLTDFITDVLRPSTIVFDKNDNLLVKARLDRKTYSYPPKGERTVWVDYTSTALTEQGQTRGTILLDHPAGVYIAYKKRNLFFKKIDQNKYVDLKIEDVYDMVITPDKDLILSTSNKLLKLTIK